MDPIAPLDWFGVTAPQSPAPLHRVRTTSTNTKNLIVDLKHLLASNEVMLYKPLKRNSPTFKYAKYPSEGSSLKLSIEAHTS
ncbi:hypothetical protein M8C21_009059, partial [Ambrosia artemisiifolia]